MDIVLTQYVLILTMLRVHFLVSHTSPLFPKFSQEYVDSSEGPSDDLSNIIFVDNLPSAPASMVPKLIAFGRDKIFAKVCTARV